MFVPRYSMRWLLVATLLGAMFFLLLSLALHGQVWAAVVVAGLGTGAFALLVQAAFFFVVWVFSRVSSAAIRGAEDAGG